MRTIIVVLFLLLYTIVSLPMYLIGFILGKMDPKKKNVTKICSRRISMYFVLVRC